MRNLKSAVFAITVAAIVVANPAAAATKSRAPRSFFTTLRNYIVHILDDSKLILPPG